MGADRNEGFDRNADFARLRDGVPPEIERAIKAGRQELALRLIDRALASGEVPLLEPALRAERIRVERLPKEYCLTRAELLGRIRAEAPDFPDERIDELMASGRLDWRYVEGEPRYMASAVDSLRFYPADAPGLAPAPARDVEARDAMLAEMHEKGYAARRITLHVSVEPTVPVADDALVRAWLPVPAACPQQSEIEILDATPGAQVARPDAPQRTAFWERRGPARFELTYRYLSVARYVAPDAIACSGLQLADAELLGEEEPSIVFTPYLRRLAEAICFGCETPVERARAIYDWITANVDYRYQPPYLLLDPIAEYAARGRRADCGVFAILFITLCRIVGIPAAWQSGLAVAPDYVGPHDWAMFRVEPQGWLWADCSFGSSARRMGEDARREHYFGNLDPWRMVANRRSYAQFEPPDLALRDDPFDNQRGEVSVDGQGLTDHEMDQRMELVSMDAVEL
jgi:transglutaminase-like putative cysteine protease